jgi:hypothetical protein
MNPLINVDPDPNHISFLFSMRNFDVLFIVVGENEGQSTC